MKKQSNSKYYPISSERVFQNSNKRHDAEQFFREQINHDMIRHKEIRIETETLVRDIVIY